MRPVLTEVLSLGCETVVGKYKNSMAQVALCNEYEQCVYNYYIKLKYVEDYETDITGITPNHLRSGKQHQRVHSEVAKLIKGRILVGHNLDINLKALGLGHPEWNKRDTASYFSTESLEVLAEQQFGWILQYGYNNAVVEARAVMRIYKEYEDEWENKYNSTDYDDDSTDYDDDSTDYDDDSTDYDDYSTD